MKVSLKVEINRNSTHWAFVLGLHPLKETFVMKKMSTTDQSSAVKKLIHTNDTDLVGSRLIFFEDFVHFLDKFIVASVLMKGLGKSGDRNVSSIDDAENPHAIEKLNFLKKLFEEESKEVIIMPGSDCGGYNSVNELQFVGGRDLIDILIVVTENIPFGSNTGEPQENSIDRQHDRREQQKAGHFNTDSDKGQMNEDKICQTEHEHGKPEQFGTCQQRYDLVII